MKNAMLSAALGAAVLVGMLVSGIETQATNTSPVENAEAMGSFGRGTSFNPTMGAGTCPGGGTAVCVACSGLQCVSACTGDFSCATGEGFCAAAVGDCETVDPGPSDPPDFHW